VATAVQLRFDVAQTPGLSDEVKTRLYRLAGGRITQEGVLVIDARRFRTQTRNREDALAQLVDLVRRATIRPKKRRPTAPSASARAERLAGKVRRGQIKAGRRPVRRDDD
jgi:ribosome-associated protein